MNVMLDQFFRTAKEIVEKDDRTIVIFGAAGVADPGELRTIINKYPTRIIDAGIMEQGIVSMAAGMSIGGMIPIFYAQAPFIVERAYEQLKVDFGYQLIGGNFVGLGASTEIAAFGPTHGCPADIGVLKLIPNMQIITPGTPIEFETLFREGYANAYPTYYRLTRYQNTIENKVKIGKANIIKKGNKATVIAVGPMLELVMSAIGDEDITILYYSSVAPFDSETLRENLTNDRVLLCEPYYAGGLSTEIIKALSGNMLKMDYIGLPLEFVTNYGYVIDNVEHFGFTIENVQRKYKELIG